jgi:hypothetical protein
LGAIAALVGYFVLNGSNGSQQYGNFSGLWNQILQISPVEYAVIAVGLLIAHCVLIYWESPRETWHKILKAVLLMPR